MALPEHFLLMYGYLLLFAWVLTAQLGIPLPSTPVLLAAGALTAEHELNFALALLAGLAGALLADSVWFFIGRRYGRQVMRLLCKVSFEPEVCVRRTQDSLGRRRTFTLTTAKFIPGVALLTSPVAGQSGMSFRSFALFDGIGCTLWLSTVLVAGRFFGDLLKRNPGLLEWVGRFSAALLILGILGFLAGRIVRRKMLLKELAAARLEPEELKRQMDAGEPVYIVDLRHSLDLLPDPFTLPGAVHILPDALAERHGEIPRDRDVVLFCDCPSEATAAKTALRLHRLGIERVRPLRGGYDEWKRLGFPVHAIAMRVPV
jgi:membrane protein DedA with SNARE-associated domain/rhodanese-related sulfurtransferase